MYIKITDGVAAPYTTRNLRDDNPRVSFPRQLTAELVAPFGVRTCETRSVPFDPLVQTHEDNGYVKEKNKWFLLKAAVNLPTAVAETNVRQHRDALMKSTDWHALSDNKMSADMTAYRQALRDVSNQDGFPFNVAWPNPI